MEDCYRIDEPGRILSPGLVLFRELVEANIDAMIEVAGGVERLRPHCKTHKMREVAEMQIARGITKHKAATFAEAEMLAQAGRDGHPSGVQHRRSEYRPRRGVPESVPGGAAGGDR